ILLEAASEIAAEATTAGSEKLLRSDPRNHSRAWGEIATAHTADPRLSPDGWSSGHALGGQGSVHSTFPVAVHVFLLRGEEVLLLRRSNTGYEDASSVSLRVMSSRVRPSPRQRFARRARK